MSKTNSSNISRKHRHLRVRKKVSGTSDLPRLNVYRSLKHIYAQVIDDVAGRTLVSASSLDNDVKSHTEELSKVEQAKLVGGLVAKRANEAGIHKVVFDRGGYKYHGRIKSLADASRESGLEF